MRIIILLWSVLVIASIGCGGQAKSAIAVPRPSRLSADEFAGEFCRKIADIDPTLSATPAGEGQVTLQVGTAEQQIVSLEDAYKNYQVAPENIELILNRAVDSSLATLREARKAKIGAAHILPVLVSTRRLHELQPSSPESAEDSGKSLYFDRLNEQLVVLYESAGARSPSYLSRADVGSLEFPSQRLRGVAVENLHRTLPKPRKYGDGQVSILTAGGKYEACLLLFDSLWTKEFFSVKGDIVVAIPSREVLLVTGSADEAGIKQISSLAREAFAKSPDPLTQQLFVRQDGKWHLFKP